MASQQLLKQNAPAIGETAQVIGLLVSSLPAVQYGPLFYSSIEIGELGVSHRTDASVSQPGNNAQPEIVHPAEAGSSGSQPGETLAKTLSDINVNMCTMASLLQTIVARQD